MALVTLVSPPSGWYNNRALVLRQSGVVNLGSGAVGRTDKVACDGAGRVHFAVTGNTTDQLSAASVIATMTDGKEITLGSGSYASGVGTESTLAELNVIGGVILQDLSGAVHRSLTLRSLRGTTLSGPAGLAPLVGVISVTLELTRAVIAGTTDYTVITSVYR